MQLMLERRHPHIFENTKPTPPPPPPPPPVPTKFEGEPIKLQ